MAEAEAEAEAEAVAVAEAEAEAVAVAVWLCGCDLLFKAHRISYVAQSGSNFSSGFQLMLTAVLCAAFGVTLVMFAAFHIWLVAKADTTIEMGQREDHEINMYASGCTQAASTVLPLLTTRLSMCLHALPALCGDEHVAMIWAPQGYDAGCARGEVVAAARASCS